MKISLIIPYFGEFPSYFDFFLKSCEANGGIDFLIFTDQRAPMPYSRNVTFQPLSFDEFKKMARTKLTLSTHALGALTPYKLCDYKPAYGVLFEDYLSETDFWGFCDVDLIFGRIFNLLSIEQVRQSERILSQGHFTLYKNCERMNYMFDTPMKGGISFRKAIEIREPCFFDEIFMPAICKERNVIQYGENFFADILPQYDDFVIAPLCAVKNKINQTFFWQDGNLFREHAGGKDELMYIHLQKRTLPYKNINFNLRDRIHITPQGFFTESEYTSECEDASHSQAKNYQKKRWMSLTLRKIWIKWKVCKFKEQLK